MEHSIKERCHVNTNIYVDTFVGIKCIDGDISVNFPLGFHVSDDEKELRRDILLLLKTLSLTIEKEDSTVMKVTQNFDVDGFPIQAYLYVISDYYNRGYYKEREIQYQINNRGKINWSKTIKTQSPFIQGAEAYYTRFVTRKNPVYFTGELTSQDFVQKIQNEMNLMYANSYDFNQMKSTLLLCAICKNNYIIGHIGDGAVLCFGKDSYVISPPQENEVGGTATYTILDYNAGEHFQFKVGKMNYLDGFLMTSDGLLGNVYYSGVDVPQLAYELFGSVYKDTSPLLFIMG